LLSIQNAVDDADPFFLLRFFHHTTLIEEGTTLASIFLAIEPWKALLAAYLDRDVGAYIDEVRKPSGPTTWDIEWIGIDRRSSVYRAYKRQDMEEGEDFSAYFNRERFPTDEFDIESSCDASGFIKGDKERWSISGDVHEIKNLPVILYSKQTLMTSSKDGLLKKNVSGVKSSKHSCLVYGDTSFSFSEVMEAIFISGLFFYAPRDAASSLDELKASLAGLEEELDRGIKESADNETDKEPTIVVAEGAFDSVAAHMETEAEEWQSIKKLCQREGELPIRIGSIKMAEPAELRLCGKIIRG
jgi:Sec-independent protein translocase protein TatA